MISRVVQPIKHTGSPPLMRSVSAPSALFAGIRSSSSSSSSSTHPSYIPPKPPLFTLPPSSMPAPIGSNFLKKANYEAALRAWKQKNIENKANKSINNSLNEHYKQFIKDRRISPRHPISKAKDTLITAAKDFMKVLIKTPDKLPNHLSLQALYRVSGTSAAAIAYKEAFRELRDRIEIHNANYSGVDAIYDTVHLLYGRPDYSLVISLIEEGNFSKTLFAAIESKIREEKPTKPKWATGLVMEHGNSVRNVKYLHCAVYFILRINNFSEGTIQIIMDSLLEDGTDIASDKRVCNPRTKLDNGIAGIYDNFRFNGLTIENAAKETFTKISTDPDYSKWNSEPSYLENQSPTQNVKYNAKIYSDETSMIAALKNYGKFNNEFALHEWEDRSKTHASNTSLGEEEKRGFRMAYHYVTNYYGRNLGMPATMYGGSRIINSAGFIEVINDGRHISNVPNSINEILAGIFARTVIDKSEAESASASASVSASVSASTSASASASTSASASASAVSPDMTVLNKSMDGFNQYFSDHTLTKILPEQFIIEPLFLEKEIHIEESPVSTSSKVTTGSKLEGGIRKSTKTKKQRKNRRRTVKRRL